MSAIPYDTPEEGWDGYEDDETLALPARRRRQFLTRGSAALFAVIVGAACFYAGVRVEKGQLPSSTSSAGGLSALTAAARGGATGAGATGRSGAAASFFGGTGRSALAAAFGSGTFGTVSSVDGKNIYVTETSTGNVVKVTLSSATNVSKSVGVSKSAIRPGDSVTIEGAKGSDGTISATSVSDSGNRSSTTSSSSSSPSSSGSAVSSLFGGG